jgi:hypothetical protein
MTFLQPFILWGIPLLFIPIIIHLLNRLRHRPQPWGAMRFLHAANRSSISQAKLRQLLVLLFRVLAVVALIFFLSRPMAGGWLGWALSPAPEVVLLVLDRSASMEAQVANTGKTRREQALTLWTEALRSYQSSRFVLIDSATQTAQEIPGLSALPQRTFTGPTQTRTDMPTLLQRAYTYLNESKSGAAEVWIASDLQESNWAPNDQQWDRLMAQFAALKQKIRFRLLSFGEDSARNASLNLVEALRRSRGSQRQLNVVLDVQSREAFADPLVLRWNLGGSSSQTELKMTGESLRWRNSFPLPNSNDPGWGTLSLSADANLADNEVFFAYDIERIPTALIVTSSPDRARPLQLAASDLSRGVAERAKVTDPNNFATANLTNAALIVWHASGFPGASIDVLTDFVNQGGALLLLPTGLSTQSFAGLSFGEMTLATTNAPFTVTKWNELEGPFARTEEGYGVPLRNLEVSQRAAISGGSAVLASFADTAPFLVRKALGKGEIYLCATSADPNWSSLADGSVLVPMLQRMITLGARRLNSGVMLDCGDTATREGTRWTRVDKNESGNPRFDAGVYRSENRFIAVNRPAAENDPTTMTAAQARKLFRDVPFQLHQERGRAGDRLQGEIWRVFVTLMLVFLILEGLLILPPKTVPTEGREAVRPRQPAEVAA